MTANDSDKLFQSSSVVELISGVRNLVQAKLDIFEAKNKAQDISETYDALRNLLIECSKDVEYSKGLYMRHIEMKNEKPTWKNVFNAHSGPLSSVDEAAKAAEKYRYPYFLWNGFVYRSVFTHVELDRLWPESEIQ